MRITSAFILLLSLASFSLDAQHFGARVGANFTNVSIDTDGADISFDNQTNLMLGLFFDLPIGGDRFMLSPEIGLVGRGYDFDFSTFGETNTNFSYLDLGVLAKLMLVDQETLGFYVGAGLVFSYALSGIQEFNGDEIDIDFDDNDGFNRSNLNGAAVAGLTFAKIFFVEGRYMFGLSSLSDGEDDPDFDFDTRWNSFGINGGIRVPLGQ